MTACERTRTASRRIRAREQLAQVDAHLRAWAGVSFACLARDLRLADDLLRARARQIGAEPRGI